MQESDVLYTGRAELRSGMLNVRSAPDGGMIGQIENGALVDVLSDEGEWVKIAYGSGTGYAAKRYICFAQAKQDVRLVITDEAGNAFVPAGGFSLKTVEGPID